MTAAMQSHNGTNALAIHLLEHEDEDPTKINDTTSNLFFFVVGGRM
jgi:hypothetical protein